LRIFPQDGKFHFPPAGKQPVTSDVRPTKITTLLYEPIYKDFTTQLKSLPLKRDAFIELMIEQELPQLAEDLAGKVNSAKARRYIAGCLKKMGGDKVGELRPLSISVRKQTAMALRDLEQEHNFPRDAFLNRLIVLLRSTDFMLHELGLPKLVRQVGRGAVDMPTSPMSALKETLFDPLHYLRIACMQQYGCGLYLLGMPWPGFACYLPDDEVPGTDAFAARRIEWDSDQWPRSEGGVPATRPAAKKALRS
jgi:hypothetical protein